MKNLSRLFSILLSVILVSSTVSPTFASGVSVKALDTTAGNPAMMLISGPANEVVQLSITNPYQGTVTKPFQLNEEGGLQYWFPSTQIAGKYRVQAGEVAQEFQVKAASPSSNKSQLQLSGLTAYMGESITGEVQLKDAFGNRIAAKQLQIEVKEGDNVSCFQACKTNQEGRVAFKIQPGSTGLKTVLVQELDSGKNVLSERIGVIPKVQESLYSMPQYGNPQPQFGQYPYYGPNPYLQPTTNNPFVPVYNPYQPSYPQQPLSQAQGNDDRLLSSWMGAQLLDEPESSSSMPSTSSVGDQLVQASSLAGFEVVFGTDEEAEFEESVEVQAQSALDFYLRAVDINGDLVQNYDGEVSFEIDPLGPLVPSDYSFTALDGGTALFELALVLSPGTYTLRVIDKNQPSKSGEVEIISSRASQSSINNTDIQLNITSPVENGKYSGSLSVQGSTSTENTEVVIREGGIQLQKALVDEDRSFSIPVQLGDGDHVLDIIATYLVDGSVTETSITLEVDQTPPVITQINADMGEVRAGETFSFTVEADEGSKLQAFINNRAYDFTADGTLYTLNSRAPLDQGEFPISLKIEDEFGNSESVQDAGTLKVIAGVEPIKNIAGIAGIEQITFIWDPVEGADGYQIRYQTVLGSSTDTKTTVENRVILKDLVAKSSYKAFITALDADGNALSTETESDAVKVLEKPFEATVISPPESPLRGAAEEVQTLPTQHSDSGPEVYLLILLSLIVLNIYSKLRAYCCKI